MQFVWTHRNVFDIAVRLCVSRPRFFPCGKQKRLRALYCPCGLTRFELHHRNLFAVDRFAMREELLGINKLRRAIARSNGGGNGGAADQRKRTI